MGFLRLGKKVGLAWVKESNYIAETKKASCVLFLLFLESSYVRQIFAEKIRQVSQLLQMSLFPMEQDQSDI